MSRLLGCVRLGLALCKYEFDGLPCETRSTVRLVSHEANEAYLTKHFAHERENLQ